MRGTLFALIAVLIAVPVSAQEKPCSAPSVTTASVEAAKPFSLMFGAPFVEMNGAFLGVDTPNDPQSVGYEKLSETAGADGCVVYATGPITLTAGVHDLWLFTRSTSGLLSLPAKLTVTATGSQPDPCAGKYPSVFVTRLIESGTGRPGARMMVLYQLASVTPVVKVEVLVDGAVVATKTATGPGDSLTDDAAMWFATPASGRHDLAVRATNGDDCQRSGTLLTPFIVK